MSFASVAARIGTVAALFVASLHAAGIRGNVTDHQSGHVLARALVTLEPVSGTAGGGRTLRTDRRGNFLFGDLPGGAYVITVSRRFFVTVEYGQKRWNSAGYPIAIGENDVPFLRIQMFHLGAISGTVVDENGVGLPEQEVVAYRNTRPPQLVTSAKADERGAYRLGGLEPGSYLVRSLPQKSDEGSFLPTFAHDTPSPDQAYPVLVDVNEEVDRIEIRPVQGPLYTLRLLIAPPEPAVAVAVTLVSETGRKTATLQGSYYFDFDALPRGQYEVFAQAPLGDRPGIQAAYERVAVTKDMPLRIGLREVNPVAFQAAGAYGQAVDSKSVQWLARRKDMAGTYPSEVLRLNYGAATLTFGPWQVALAPTSPNLYVSNFLFTDGGSPVTSERRADGWNEFVYFNEGSVRFTLQPTPGTVRGKVTSHGDPVVGAPVFLEPYDLPAEKRVSGIFSTRTDLHGEFKFAGLVPGLYRILSTFEYQKPDADAMSVLGSRTVSVSDSGTVDQELEKIVIN